MKGIINKFGLFTTKQVEDTVQRMEKEVSQSAATAKIIANDLEYMKNKINNLSLNNLCQSEVLFALAKDEYKFMLREDQRAIELFILIESIGKTNSIFVDKDNDINIIETKIVRFNVTEGKVDAEIHITAYDQNAKEIKGWLEFYVNGNGCEIETVEVKSRYKKKGIGSYMLKVLEQIAKGYRVETIKAWLSPADSGRRYEQIPFYTDNKYELMFNGKKDYTEEDIKLDGWAIKKLSPLNDKDIEEDK